MIKQKDFIDCQEINFWISFYFFQKLDFSVFVDFEKFQPLIPQEWTLKSLNLIYVCIIVKFALNDRAKGFSWFSGDWFFNLIFVHLLDWA